MPFNVLASANQPLATAPYPRYAYPMSDSLRDFFELNRIVVLFMYGQVFFVIGLAIALQSRRHSHLELARSLGWLAAFGIAHGLHEWALIFIPIQATYLNTASLSLLQVLQVVLLALSFGFLFQFGAELVRECWSWVITIPLVIMVGWGLWFVLPGLALSGEFAIWHKQASIWARYLIGFPGGLLAAYGLRHQAERYIKPLNLTHIYRTLRMAGLALGAYAILGGLIVPAADFFPANWLNETRLVDWLGIPAPVFRSFTGLVIAVTIIRALEVFDLETDQLIEQMESEQNLMAERDRIGRELHDGTIQQVYTAGLIVESARRKVADETVVAQRLDRAMTALDEAITGLRAYMGNLRTQPATLSLVEGLRQQTINPRLTALMEIDLTLELPESAELSPLRTTHVLSILNEALANAARHAQARHVHVQATQAAGQFALTIRDDGRGFSDKPNKNGYGLRNMRDRARLLGGALRITSQPNQGTQIVLLAPWEEK